MIESLNCCPKPCLRGTFSYKWGWSPERVRLPNLSRARGPDPQTIPDQLLPSTSLQPDRFLSPVGLHLHDPRKQQVFMDRKFSNGCLSKYWLRLRACSAGWSFKSLALMPGSCWASWKTIGCITHYTLFTSTAQEALRLYHPHQTLRSVRTESTLTFFTFSGVSTIRGKERPSLSVGCWPQSCYQCNSPGSKQKQG